MKITLEPTTPAEVMQFGDQSFVVLSGVSSYVVGASMPDVIGPQKQFLRYAGNICDILHMLIDAQTNIAVEAAIQAVEQKFKMAAKEATNRL